MRWLRNCSVSTRAAGVLAAAGALAVASSAESALQILKANGTPVPEGAATVSFNPETGGWTIILHELYNPAGETVYNIRGNGGETIDAILIDVPCWEGPNGECAAAGSPVIVRVFSDEPAGVKSVHNIMQTGTAETILNIVEAREDIGAVSVLAIGSLEAGRDIVGPVTATTLNSNSRGITFARAERDILGDIRADFGRASFITAGRHIGTAQNPVTIRANNNIVQVSAVGDIHADIHTNVNGGSGFLWRLTGQRFFGTLRTSRIDWNTHSNLPGLVRITSEFVGLIEIAQSFNDTAHVFQLPSPPSGGIGGQIIINASGAAGGTWTAPISLGPAGHPDQVVLVGPTYPQPSTAIGGGSIGLAPFRLHHQSSSPPSGADVPVPPGGPPLVVTLEHFGPVKWNEALQPLVIERRPADSGGSYVALPIENFVIVPASDVRGVLVGAVHGQPGFEPGYQYRITQTSALRSNIPAAPHVIWTQPYTVTVVDASSCMGDLNQDGAVDALDLLMLLDRWGPAPAGGAAGGGGAEDADLNGDGIVDLLDLLLLLDAWGPCPVQAPAQARLPGERRHVDPDPAPGRRTSSPPAADRSSPPASDGLNRGSSRGWSHQRR